MKNLWIAIIISAIIFSCTNRSSEDRFIFEEERILDLETGDEYYINKMDTLTIVNIEGESSEIVVTAAPFSDSDELDRMMAAYKEKLSERKDSLVKEQKEKIKAERAERYSEYDDQELLAFFNKIHKEERPYEQQLDVIAELVSRDAVLETDVAKLLEVDTVTLDFEIDYIMSEDTE
jgi:flagellum-specific peptidoglycan hydrolase FlgJ